MTIKIIQMNLICQDNVSLSWLFFLIYRHRKLLLSPLKLWSELNAIWGWKLADTKDLRFQEMIDFVLSDQGLLNQKFTFC